MSNLFEYKPGENPEISRINPSLEEVQPEIDRGKEDDNHPEMGNINDLDSFLENQEEQDHERDGRV